VAWIIETIGDLKKMVEPFDDEMRITPLKIDYDYPASGEATLKIGLLEPERFDGEYHIEYVEAEIVRLTPVRALQKIED